MEELQNWLFHYNPYRKAWFAFRREDSNDYFNGEYKNVIKSRSHKTLEELIVYHQGDIVKINEAVALNK